MKLSDVKTVGQLKGEDFDRIVILTQANNEAGHRIQGNHVGLLTWFSFADDGRIILIIDTTKGETLRAHVGDDWAVIFPTKAHPLYKA